MSTSPPPRPRVLVVDDEPENVRTVARVFRRELHVTGASSVAEARAELDRSSFDVALVDFSMPGENGIVLLREIVARGLALPSLLVTAHGTLDEVLEARRAGLCKGIVMKPWNAEELRRWVQQVMRMSQLRSSVGAMRRDVDDD